VQNITLTTDFGTQDWFVGTMKGVILGIAPHAAVTDITHEIPAGDIRAGAFALAASFRYFPKGTVHVVVVDPGVGSARHAIAVQTADYFFVGPDNGILSWALRHEKIKSIRRLTNAEFFLKQVSRTFHGRDIFAPVAAHLSRGVPMQKLGPPAKEFVRLRWPEPQIQRDAIEGEVVYVDHFGNAIANIDANSLRIFCGRPCEVFSGRKRLCAVGEFYQSVLVGQAVAVPGSNGFLEIAVNGGLAARKLDLCVGTALTVKPAQSAFKSR
jgi:S-adenosylmethionine hydrolase